MSAADSATVLQSSLDQHKAELARRLYFRDPVAWVNKRLNEQLWSKQVDIMRAVAANRATAVASCHGIGKSFIAARTVAWWLDRVPVGDAFAVTSATTGAQVAAILWREIGRAHSKGHLRGRVNQTEWYMTPVGGKEELVAFGRKPADYDPTAFQGIHAPYVLVVLDEACGIPIELWQAADTLISNDNSKMLVIGNPDDPQSEFQRVCRPGSGWRVLHVGAFDTPNFTGEGVSEKITEQLIGRRYVEDKRRRWAPQWVWDPQGKAVVCPPGVDEFQTHPYWQSKILGRFPTQTEDPTLIPYAWVKAAQARSLEGVLGPNILGVDVGGGGDSSTGCHRRGQIYRIVWCDRNPDTMHTCGNAVDYMFRLGAEAVRVDIVGIGRGVVDRGREQGYNFVGVNVGTAPIPRLSADASGAFTQGKLNDVERFLNLRAQLWWEVRTLFEYGLVDIDPADEQLEEELLSIRFRRLSNGKIQIETKEEARKRGIPSPNRADALMLAAAELPAQNILEGAATW